MSKKKNDIFKFKAKIGGFEITSRKKKTKYPKYKLWLAKTMGLDLKDNYEYLVRIQYYGSKRLEVDDIVISEQGVYFVVLKEHNRLAMLATMDLLTNPPVLHGRIAVFKKDFDLNKIK